MPGQASAIIFLPKNWGTKLLLKLGTLAHACQSSYLVMEVGLLEPCSSSLACICVKVFCLCACLCTFVPVPWAWNYR